MWKHEHSFFAVKEENMEAGIKKNKWIWYTQEIAEAKRVRLEQLTEGFKIELMQTT